jgi:hypothetical protein
MSRTTKRRGKTRRVKKSSKSRRNRGGRPTIDNELLFRHRDGLIALFSATWGTLGWYLHHATTRADVVAMFSLSDMPAHNVTALQPFTRSTTHVASDGDVRAVKRAVNAAWRKTVDFEKRLRRPADRVRQTLHALQQGVEPEHRDVVLAQHRRRLNEYATLRAEADDHDEKLKRLQSLQADCDAAYSQDQVLLFLKKRKYKWNPRNLAHALAGLPQMGWEQSFKRCGNQEGWWPSREYRVFQLIEKCSDKSPDRFKGALEAAIRALPNRKPNDTTFREYLFTNWPFLRMAIDEAAALDDPLERRPYRTFEIYMKRIGQSRTPKEQFIASMEELIE